MVRGQRLAGVLRKAIREHYGPQAEQLVAFGLQPFRGRKPRAEEPPPVSEVSGQAHDTNDR